MSILNYKNFLVCLCLASALPLTSHDHVSYVEYCMEGNWREIQAQLENGYRPHFKIVSQLIKQKEQRKNVLHYICSVVVIYSALYMARNSAQPPHPISCDTRLIEMILSIIYGGLLSGIEITILDSHPKLSSKMLHQTLEWLVENDQRHDAIADLVRNHRVGQRHIENFIFYLADENMLQAPIAQTFATEKKDALVDTGCFDTQSGMYNPNFMNYSTYELCKREKMMSAPGFAFILPPKFVDDLDDYLFGTNNPFTREQRNNIDIDKIDLVDKCTQMALAVPHSTAQALCKRFKTELEETELTACCDETTPTHYSLPKLASSIRKYQR